MYDNWRWPGHSLLATSWRWPRHGLLAAFLLVGLMALAAGATVTHAATQPGYYQVVNRWDNSCLDVLGASPDWAAKVGVWRCVGADNQQWRPEYVGDGFYRLRVLHTGMCLDVAWASQADGADVVQSTCVPGVSQQNQQWRLASTTDGYFELVARHSGKCLDKSYGSVVQWRCHGVSWQEWRFR